MTDIIDEITSLYKRNGGSESKQPAFWLACAKAGVKEIEDDIIFEDYNHMTKEFADLVFIGIDALNKMGYDTRAILKARAEENAKKDLRGRTTEFYLKKALGVRKKHG